MRRRVTALLALALVLPGVASAATLGRKPYVQSTTPTSAVVVWTTAAASLGEVRYGPTPTSLSQVASGPSGTQHEVTLTGLTPGSTVCYSVGAPGEVLAGGDGAHCFLLPPPVGTRKKLRAWIVGDSGTGGTPQAKVRDAMLAAVGGTRPSVYLHMGDMAYDTGTAAEFSANFFAMYEPVLPWVSLFPTMGNHEGMSSDSGTQTGPYYTAYVLPKAGQSGGLPSGTEAYYAFDWGNAHFLVLDSHDSSRSPTGPMLTWAKADLAATKQEWIVAFWHHPPYTKGSHDSDTESQLVEMRENALPILEAAGVDLVLAGHSHIYERSFLVDSAYATPTSAAGKIKDSGDGSPLGKGPYVKPPSGAHGGSVYVVAGHGGTGVSGPGGHPLMVKTELKNGSCVLDVHENRLSLFNVRVDGAITDRFTMVKGTGLVVSAPDGGETLSFGQKTNVTWSTVGTVGMVRLELSLDDGASWTPIAGPVANTGTFAWTVPSTPSDRALVRVLDAANMQVRDESNGVFRIDGSTDTKVIAMGSVWKYADDGKDPGPAWATPGFDDAAWKSGPAQLGYGDGDEATVLAKATPVHASAYFRKQVAVAGKVSAAAVTALHDDGIALFVNGKEVWNRYVGDTSNAAFADQQSADNEVSKGTFDGSAFVVGQNTIAAVVKQSSGTSSDLSFDLELVVTETMLPPGPGGAGGAGGAGVAGAAGIAGIAGAGGGAAGGPTTAGAPSAGGTSAAGAVNGGEAVASGTDEGGCGCGVSGGVDAGLLAVVAAGLAAGRRRRRAG